MSILGRSLAFALTVALVSILLDLLLWRLTIGARAPHRLPPDLSLHELVHLLVFVASAAAALLSFSPKIARLPPTSAVLALGLLTGGAGLPAAAWFSGRFGPLAGGTIFFAVALMATRWGARMAAR